MDSQLANEIEGNESAGVEEKRPCRAARWLLAAAALVAVVSIVLAAI